MAKENIKKAKETQVRHSAAKQSGSAAKISDTAVAPEVTLKSPGSSVNTEAPSAPARVSLQTQTPVTVSKPVQSPEKQLQKATANSVAAQGSLTASAVKSSKPATQAEPNRLPEKAIVVSESAVLSELARVKVTFVFPVCECCPNCVSLSGDFNGWSPNATPMKRYDDGHWEISLELAPGRYEYKFVRDGEWMPDLMARENVLNGYGTLNSVIVVRAS